VSGKSFVFINILLLSYMIKNFRIQIKHEKKHNNHKTFIFVTNVMFIVYYVFLASISRVFMQVSHHNYPGGVALSKLVNNIIPNGKTKSGRVNVHMDAYSAMNGISRFGQVPKVGSLNVTYSKDEKIQERNTDISHFKNFDYLITANPSKFYADFLEEDTVHQFSSISLHRPFSLPSLYQNGVFKISTVPKLYIMKRKSRKWF